MRKVLIPLTLMLAVLLNGCGQAPVAVQPTQAPPGATTLISPSDTTAPAGSANLNSVKAYLVNKVGELTSATATFKQASDRYYALVQAGNFDYAMLWQTKRPEMTTAIQAARAAWVSASPLYEQMEGIVAGTPSLAQFDVDLDAGDSAATGGENVVSFDLPLPDGKTLPKPGNIFGLTESILWGTFADNASKDVQADLNGDGKADFGDAIPDANLLKGSVDLLDQKANELAKAAAAWQPTEAEAFGALVGNVPTVSDFFDSWKNSRFVQTDPSKASRDFVVVSRLSDIVDNITSWQTIYSGLSPLAVKADPATDEQIQQGLRDLKIYVSDIYSKEQLGKRYTPEEADLLSAEAQNRATAITGQITQVAALLKIDIREA